MSSGRVAVGLALMLTVGACGSDGGSGSATSSSSTTPLGSPISYVIDSDGAFDDFKAIVYLLQQPDIAVRALTMSGTGVVHCPQGAQNATAVLESVGADAIPVACGRTTPLEGTNEAPSQWRAQADNLGGMELPEPRRLSELAAPELLVKTINDSPTKVVLVGLGPLTNIAEAIQRDPSFLDNIEMMYLMGGAVDVGGNVLYANLAAEFNIWADPHAAALVFASGMPITLVPLDATNDVPVTPYLYNVFAAHTETPAAQFMSRYLAANPFVGGLYHWDELTAVVSTDERVVTIEERRLSIIEAAGPDQGATVEQPEGRAVRVAVATDAPRFEDHFYTAIIGAAPNDIAAWTPDAIVSWDGTSCRYDGPDPLPERFVVRLDNSGSDVFALATGTYAPRTTQRDLADYLASQPTQTPTWFTQLGTYPSPAGAHDVWMVTAGGRDVTALCYVDVARFWEIAGPRLPP